jgi:hypothetical protein
MQDVLEQELIGKPVTVTLGGCEYKLSFRLRAIILYKQKTGDNLFLPKTWPMIAPAQDPERFLACLWAGLQRHHPEMTIEKLEDLIDFSNSAEVVEAIARALTAHFPKRQEDSDPNASAAPQDDEPILAAAAS